VVAPTASEGALLAGGGPDGRRPRECGGPPARPRLGGRRHQPCSRLSGAAR